MRKRILLLLSVILLVITRLSAQTINIAAAADLRNLLDQVANDFRTSNPDVKVEIIYGSSGNLYQQILNQAPFDILFT